MAEQILYNYFWLLSSMQKLAAGRGTATPALPCSTSMQFVFDLISVDLTPEFREVNHCYLHAVASDCHTLNGRGNIVHKHVRWCKAKHTQGTLGLYIPRLLRAGLHGIRTRRVLLADAVLLPAGVVRNNICKHTMTASKATHGSSSQVSETCDGVVELQQIIDRSRTKHRTNLTERGSLLYNDSGKELEKIV